MLTLAGVVIFAVLTLWALSPWVSEHDLADQPIAEVNEKSTSADAASRVSIEARRERAQLNPRDGRGWALLAYAALEENAYAEAATAFEKAVTVSPKVAADPGVLCDWADALGMAQGGILKGRPIELVSRALTLSSTFPKALEMAGSAAYEQREFALAAEYWRQLLPQMAEGSAGRRALADGIARAERLAAMSPPVQR